ncbi:CST complex subunit CTC1 isoform X2 [Gymnodraco acuticeps]|uniref:CST complex subunit CTC1 n=1 Tax=Gymnodraco acuticeps TaxID=8218 RepID=A0A6P8UNQ2_GYMAC|nr:CST complex subunit CTC1 isoform X2 [Gymnodraco acuticeps]
MHTDYTHPAAHTYTPAATAPPPVMSQVEDCEEAEPERDTGQSAARMKKSRVISYQGTVTEVVSEGAGLYVMDRRVGLCLAYQPALRRKLRIGDTLELHHVHFLYRPCPDFLPSMLCTCLRSSVRVTSFSGGWAGGVATTVTAHLHLPGGWNVATVTAAGGKGRFRIPVERSPEFKAAAQPGPRCVEAVCVCSVLEADGVCVERTRRTEERHLLRDAGRAPLLSSDSGLQTDSWSSVSLRSLLPPGGGLSSSQINSALSWSCRTLTSDPPRDTSRRPLVVGVLELPSPAGQALQLRDGTGTVACVVTETSEGGGQSVAFNTAWIGCLVCVEKFTMVTERFLQSDFPSDQHLDQDKYITHKHCRFYLQFSLDQLHILSPSIAMETHLRGAEPGGDVTEEEEEPSGGKRRRRGDPRPCVSMVIRVQQKEGVALRNSGAGSHQEEAGLTASFSVTAAVIGPVVSWGRDPKNRPLTDREAEPERKDKLVLVLSGVSARWFPLLQPGCFYRLIAANTQDPSVLIGCAVSGRRGVELHADSIIQVRTDWRFHTLTRPLLLLHTCTQARSPPVSTLSEVLDCSSEVVCFQAQVTDRISVTERSRGSAAGVCAGVRLTVCDQSGRSLQVYLDLSHTPYPPGLLPGNTLLLSAFQRRVSRSGGVYCSQLPVSSLTVTSLGDSSCVRPPPAPMMHLGVWTGSREQRCFVGRVRGHVVCLLLLQLRWSCSLCGGLYTQSCSSAQCGSSSSVFQSTVKLVIDDGTGEAHVWFSGAQVRALLGLADSQWEGLQRALRVRGHIRVYPRGRSLVCDSEDPLLHFLLCVCSSEVVCRQLSLTCRKQKAQRSEEMKRFSRGDRDFMTRVTPPLKLTCTHLHSD